MAIEIVDNLASVTPFSINGDQTNPIISVHDGRINVTRDVLLYAENEIATPGLQYTDVVLSFVDYGLPNDTEGYESGWYMKISPGETQPTEAQWAAIEGGSDASLSDITPANPYEPFWLRIHSPRGLNVGYKADLAIKIEYIEDTV